MRPRDISLFQAARTFCFEATSKATAATPVQMIENRDHSSFMRPQQHRLEMNTNHCE